MAVDLDAVARELTTQASLATNETDLRVRIEPIVDRVRVELGLTADPTREKTLDATTNTITFRGRADTMYGAVVIEYEPPKALSVAGSKAHAAKQAREYMLASASHAKGHEFDALRRHAGIVFDGNHVGFLRATGPYDPARPLADQLETLIPLDGPFPINGGSLAQFFLYLRALGRKRLEGKALADVFGPEAKANGLAPELVKHLCSRLSDPALPPKAALLSAEWMRAFGAVYLQDPAKARQDAGVLAKLYAVPDGTKLPTLLFAVQTYYALLMKLLAVEVLSLQAGSIVSSQATRIANADADERQRILTDLESGALFAAHGIDNFLEGDYFSWYLSAWTAETADLVQRLASELSQFEPASSTLDPDTVRDLLKDLYQFLVPKKVRHDLGEYYTPDWLADYLLDQAGYDGDVSKRMLDPACGSGTFLLRAIARIRAVAARDLLDEETTGRLILANVVGFDLNPVAVLAARTNYLLGLGTLLRKITPLSLPVYLADSLLAPLPYSRLMASAFTKATTDHLVRASTVGDFKYPIELADRDGLRIVTEELEAAIPARVGADAFIARVAKRRTTTQSNTEKLLRQLYEKVAALDAAGKNGIWARLLRNAFAPALSGQFDFVIGNPPWINWESLSDEYRKVTTRLWELHGLFTLTGMKSILGGSKRDIAMLFYVCGADYYLRDGGVLAYLFPQTTFQTSPSGDGFRKFTLGSSVSVGPFRAGDLVAIQPFEGAANWTGYLVARKGEAVSYPVPYDLWTRNGGGVPQDDDLPSALARTTRQDLIASPSNPKATTSPWVIGNQKTVPAAQRMAGSNPFVPRAGVTTWADGIYRGTVSAKLADGTVTFANDADRAKGKTKPKKTTVRIEPDYIFPFIEWKDLQAFSAKPSGYILIPQNPASRTGFAESALRVSHPRTSDYLTAFKPALLKRSGYTRYFGPKKSGGSGQAFYTVFNFGTENLAAVRVAWATMGTRFRAAVIENVDDPFLGSKAPQVKNTVIFVPVAGRSEGDYLAGLLNSTPLNYLATFSSVRGGKSFGSGGFLSRVRIGAFNPADPTHAEIAKRSSEAATATAQGDDAGLATARAALDLAAAAYWGITGEEVGEMERLLASLGRAIAPEGDDDAPDDEEDPQDRSEA